MIFFNVPVKQALPIVQECPIYVMQQNRMQLFEIAPVAMALNKIEGKSSPSKTGLCHVPSNLRPMVNKVKFMKSIKKLFLFMKVQEKWRPAIF